MIDPASVALFIPPELRKFKLDLFERIGKKIGRVVRHDPKLLERLPDDVVPIVGCTPALRPIIDGWRVRGRQWIYWDRGYARRVFATWLPRGERGGYYRWHVGSCQAQKVRDVPADRWLALGIQVRPWSRGGRHVVVAGPSTTYQRFHQIEGWLQMTMMQLNKITKRPIILRDKESKIPLYDAIAGAHCLVTHGSNAAVEAAIMGCPVFVSPDSAAALVGRTDLAQLEEPIYPDRMAWVRSLAYDQFNEDELVDGTLWRLIN